MAEFYSTHAQAEVLLHIWRGPKTYKELANLTGRSVSAVKKSVAEWRTYREGIIDSRVATEKPDSDGRRPNEYFLIPQNIVSTPAMAVLLVTADDESAYESGRSLTERYIAITGYDVERVNRRFQAAKAMDYLEWVGRDTRKLPVLTKRSRQEFQFIKLLAAEFDKTKVDRSVSFLPSPPI